MFQIQEDGCDWGSDGGPGPGSRQVKCLAPTEYVIFASVESRKSKF